MPRRRWVRPAAAALGLAPEMELPSLDDEPETARALWWKQLRHSTHWVPPMI